MSKEKPKLLKAEAFTVKANMKNAVVAVPPPTGVYWERPIKPTTFRKVYDSGQLPIALDYNNRGHHIKWKVELEKMDYHHFLPLFFDGLCETAPLYEYLVIQGIHDMLDHGGAKIRPVLPQLIIPIRNAMNTRNHQVMCNTLKVLQHLVVSGDKVGEALVPYFRQILPVFNLFKNMKDSTEDGCSHQKGDNLPNLIQETLEMFERHGGEDALTNIIYMVPTYLSC